MKGKKGSVSNKTMIGIAVVFAILLVAVVGMMNYNSNKQLEMKIAAEKQQQTAKSEGNPSGQQYQLQCDANAQQTVPISVVDKYTSGTNLAGYTLKIWENGVLMATTATSNTSLTATRGRTYEVLATKTGYVSVVDKFSVSCDPVGSKKYEMGQYMNVTPTGGSIYCYDKNNAVLDGNTKNYTINTGVQPNINCKIEPAADKLQPEGIWVLTAPQATYDEIRLSMDGAKAASVPAQHSGTTGSKDYAFYVPAIDGKNTKTIDFTVTPMTTSGQDPSTSSDIKLTQYDLQYAQDSKSGLLITMDYAKEHNLANPVAGDFGYAKVTEDSKKTDVGSATETATEFIPVQ